MIRRILVGLGGRENAEATIRTSLDLAKSHGAELTGISVLDEARLEAVGPVPLGAGQGAAELRDYRLGEAKKVIEEVSRQFEAACQEAGIPFTYQPAAGDPYQALADKSRYHDVVVCGLHQLFEHGVAEEPPAELVRLVQSGVRPLITVTNRYRPVERVLVAYSGSMESAKAMKRFVQLRLWPAAVARIVTFEHEKAYAEELLRDAAAYFRAHDYSVESQYLSGSPKRGLLAYAADWDADLIVMGNSNRSLLLRRIFGETMLHTVRNADRPLFLAQ